MAEHYDSVYALMASANPKTQLAQLKLWHERLGHANFTKVASILGFPAPSPPPACLTCMAAKSKRRPLTGSSGIHEGIRPGYAWAWDHVGPFKVKTWSGKGVFSLKVDIFSGKREPSMTASTGACELEWQNFVLRLEAHFGRQVVSRLITDSAPYFELTQN